MKDGQVSIITPVYNAEKYISETITSVLSQTYTNWEMIVIDDGSKDKSLEIIKKFAESENRIQVYQQSNAGSAAARNNGIRRASGQYICLLDADDTWESIFLESQLKFMKEKKAHLVYSSSDMIDENSHKILKPFMAVSSIAYKDLLKTCSIACLTGVYDTKPFGKVYLKEEFKSLRDDYIYWLEIIKHVGIAYGNPAILAHYRVLSQSATSKKQKLIIPQFKVLRNVEKLSLVKSLYYLCTWAFYGFKKYKI